MIKDSEKPAWLQTLDDLPTTRVCGRCDACCTVLRIEELDKPAGARCAHLCGQGCAIWGEHPDSCKTYVCLWRLTDTVIAEHLFPADCGFVLSLHSVTEWPAMVTLGRTPGSQPEPWTAPEIFAGLAALAASWNCPVIMLDAGLGTHLITPMGHLYARADHPEMFPQGGVAFDLPDAEYGPDRRAPYLRMREQSFRWPSA